MECAAVKLLISPVDEVEALEAVAGGADIVDVKNQLEGALGANFPWVIKRVRQVTPKTVAVSCTLGDLANLPGTAALAALGAASTGVDYIKASLYGVKTQTEAVFLMRAVVKAAHEQNALVKVAVAGFADASRVGSVDPLLVPQIAHDAGADVAMLDTAVKDGRSLLSFLTVDALRGFVKSAHGLGLQAALAGSLRKQDLSILCGLGADIVGVRGAACVGGDRVKGHIERAKVAELAKIVHSAAR
jgi:uncharacterized protein (UPF0264 family)